MILHNLIKTCGACPSQWEAKNEHGEGVYIRFRYDTLTVHCPYDDNGGWEAFRDSQILEIENIYGNEYAGEMEEDEMLRLTGYTKGE